MQPQFPKLYVLRLFQLSLGMDLQRLIPLQLGLDKPEIAALHDIFEGHTRQQGPPSYRVRLCRRCNGTTERVDKGTYDTLEDACLVHDTWQLMNGNEANLHVLVPGDEEWVKMIAVRKLSRKVQKVVTLGAIFDVDTDSSSSNGREEGVKRTASALMLSPLCSISPQRDGLTSLVAQFGFFENSLAAYVVRDNIVMTSALQAFAAAMQVQRRRKVARLMQEAAETVNERSVMPRSSIILLQAVMLRLVLYSSLQVPLQQIPTLIQKVEALAPAVPVNDLAEALDRELQLEHAPVTEACIERGQVLAASALRFLFMTVLHSTFPKQSELSHESDSLWTILDELYPMVHKLHAICQKLARLIMHIRTSPYYSNGPESLETTVEPMFMGALHTLVLGATPTVALLVYFAPSHTTAKCVRDMSDAFAIEERLFPNVAPVVRLMTREMRLSILLAQIKLQEQHVVDTSVLTQLDAVALFVIASRYNQYGVLRKGMDWHLYGPPETEVLSLTTLLAYACFRPSLTTDCQHCQLLDHLTPENSSELVDQCLRTGKVEGHWCYEAIRRMFPQFTVHSVLEELEELMRRYSAFAEEMQIGFLTSPGLVAVGFMMRLIKHHCHGADHQLVASIDESLRRIMDLSNKRFRIPRFIGQLFEQPLFVNSSCGDDVFQCDGFVPRPRTVAEVMNEAFDDPDFDKFYTLADS